MQNFTDSKFLTAQEKASIYKSWCRFVDRLATGDIDSAEKAFSKRLYHHLMQHCGYIAHYDQNGFWHTYFEGFCNVDTFLKTWDEPYKAWMNDYSDINAAMQEYVAPKIRTIIELQYNMERIDQINTAKRTIKQYGLTASDLELKP
jgi:hypothetical protein